MDKEIELIGMLMRKLPEFDAKTRSRIYNYVEDYCRQKEREKPTIEPNSKQPPSPAEQTLRKNHTET